MTWEELKEKAKNLGYIIKKDEVWNDFTGLHFTKDGTFYYWSFGDNPTFAEHRTPEQMYQIMLALQ